MHQTLPAPPLLPQGVVDAALSRLGDWESADDRPAYTIPNQQLELPPSSLSAFTVHVDAPEQVLRFQGCQDERRFWLQHLPNIDPDPMRLARFRQCGKYAWVTQDLATGRYFLRGESCKQRICPVCRRRIQHRSSERVLDFMRSSKDLPWQFITFTLKHAENPLTTQLTRLIRSFRRLRQRKNWQRCVSTGYAVIEVTYHKAGTMAPGGRFRESDEWHPHLHVVAQTAWIDWSWLHTAWLEITGDSDNVDCQIVESASHAAFYVSKYIGKPPDIDLRNQPTRAAEYYHALQHRRLLMPFGATTKHHPPAREPSPPTERICRFSALLTAAANGDYSAECTLAYIILGTVPRPSIARIQQQHLFNRGPP